MLLVLFYSNKRACSVVVLVGTISELFGQHSRQHTHMSTLRPGFDRYMHMSDVNNGVL